MSDSGASTRSLTPGEESMVRAARDKAFVLYEGRRVKHRSCGIALAETFGLPTRPYQALRRGGITGQGQCGAIRAGEQVLGELLGDPSPTGAVTEALRDAIVWYQDELSRRLELGGAPDLICNTLTRPLGEFSGERRMKFCTNLAADVAALVCEAWVRFHPSDSVLTVEPLSEEYGG